MSGATISDVATPVSETILESLSLKLAVAGLVTAVAGTVVHTGTIPAFMVIWGLALFLIGSISHLVIAYRAS